MCTKDLGGGGVYQGPALTLVVMWPLHRPQVVLVAGGRGAADYRIPLNNEHSRSQICDKHTTRCDLQSGVFKMTHDHDHYPTGIGRM